MGSKRRGWGVVLALLAQGCWGEVPEGERVPPPATLPVLPPAAPAAVDGQRTWRLTVPESLQASGGKLSVTRLRPAAHAEEELVPVLAGQQVLVLSAAPDETLSVAAQAGSVGPWEEGGLLSSGCAQESPQPGPHRELHVPRDYPTLQAAVDAAAPGDTVQVAAGVYREQVRLTSGVRLRGEGMDKTVLDGAGEARTLVDFTDARDVVISGFTFRNVGQAAGCAAPDQPLVCSGDWYAAAIYGDGHGVEYAADSGVALCPSSSALITNNLFEGNDIAVLAYFHALAAVRNNLFVHNHHGVALNHMQDVALVANNVFWENRGLAIGNSAAYADIVDNIIARSGTGIRFEAIQQGRVRCNLFYDNAQHWSDEAFDPAHPRLMLGEDGNVELDPLLEAPELGRFQLQPGSPGAGASCFTHRASEAGGSGDVGAYGGPFGQWP